MRTANKRYDHDFSEVRVHPENIGIIDRTRKPKIFSVWNDAFISSVPFHVWDLLFEAIYRNPQHIVLICTKRPDNMANFIIKWLEAKPVLHNCFLATTVENQEMANKRIPELLKCSPFKLFLSIEPMLSNIIIPQDQLKKINYCIAGSESGTHARPTDEAWITSLRQQCIMAGVPLWVKQLRTDGEMGYDSQFSTISKEDLWNQSFLWRAKPEAGDSGVNYVNKYYTFTNVGVDVDVMQPVSSLREHDTPEKECLQMIADVAVGYDGFGTVDSLKGEHMLLWA